MNNSRDMPAARDLVGGPLVEIFTWLLGIAVQIVVGAGIVYGAIWLIGFREAVAVILALLVIEAVFDRD